MRHPLVAACLALFAVFCSPTLAQQYTIGRNTDDCIAPNVREFNNACDKARVYPKSKYWATGTATVRSPDGSVKITNKAGFSVTYYNTHKVVINEIVKETYVLYHCGCNRPSSIPSGAKVFQIPLQSISADDTSVGEFMNQCSVIDRVAYASEVGVNGCYQLLAQCGYGAPDVGFKADAASKIANQVDAFITYGKVAANPKSIAMSAVAASHPLLRAEWLKYFASFFNKEYESEALYRIIRNSYNGLKRDVAALKQPTRIVAWTYLGFSGADYVISRPAFKVAYVQDAGGKMVDDATLSQIEGFKKLDNGDWSLPMAYPDSWAELLSKVDVIIDETYSFSTGTLVRKSDFISKHKLTGYAKNIPAISKNQVYSIAGTVSQTVQIEGSDYLGSVGLDWYERGTARADEVLRDFVQVLLPSNVWPSSVQQHKRRWLLRLNGETQVQVPKTCPVATAQLDAKCVRKQKYVGRICPNTIRNCTTGNFVYPQQAKRCAAVDNQKTTMRLRLRQKLPKCVIARR